MKKFELGRLLITRGALTAIELLEIDGLELLGRHQGGDWSEMDEADIEANKQAVEVGTRIFSSYTVKGLKIWIITEADRSTTTILLPDEY